MEFSRYAKTDPALMLLSEIDILLAQIRLLELHLKRAQAVTDDNMARLQEQFQAELSARDRALAAQKESIAAEAERAALELRQAPGKVDAELPELRAALEKRDQDLRNLQAAAFESERDLKSRLSRAQHELEQQRNLLASREEEMRAGYTRIAALEQRVMELEAASQSISANPEHLESLRRAHEEIAALRYQTEVQERALTERQEAVTAVELALHGKIQALNRELALRCREGEERDIALESARAEQDVLRGRIAELTSAATQADTQAREAAETLRRELSREIDRLSAALAEQQSAALHQQSLFKSTVDGLNAEIEQRRNEFEQQRVISAQENAEADRLRAAVRAFEQQSIASEMVRRQSEENRQHAIRRSDELAASLEAKDAELRATRSQFNEQLESAGVEQQGKLKALEERFNHEIAVIRQQLESEKATAEQAHGEIAGLRALVADFEERNSEFERLRLELEQSRGSSDAQSRELQARLQLREDELSAAQAKAREGEAMFESKIDELQIQLREKQLLAESRATEIASLKARLSQLSAQLAEQESILKQTQITLMDAQETTREADRAEINALEETHRIALRTLEQQLADERQTVAELRNQMLEIQDQHRHAEMRLDQLQTLHEKENGLSDSDDQARKRLELELEDVRSELKQKAWALAQQQATLENLALAHKSQIDRFESKFEETQRDMNNRELELASARAQIQVLERRLEDFHSELATLEESRQRADQYASKIEDLTQQLARCGDAVKEREAEAQLVQSLRGEIQRQIREAHEKNQILEDRNDEVVRVKAELDQLHERLNQLQSARSEAEHALSSDAERARTEFQAQLASLQAELSQKEWALEERQAASHGLEQGLRQEIESLRRQLAAHESVKQKPARDFLLGEARSDRTDGQRFPAVEDGVATAGEASRSSYHRRWHTGLGWKRRWRS